MKKFQIFQRLVKKATREECGLQNYKQPTYFILF